MDFDGMDPDGIDFNGVDPDVLADAFSFDMNDRDIAVIVGSLTQTINDTFDIGRMESWERAHLGASILIAMGAKMPELFGDEAFATLKNIHEGGRRALRNAELEVFGVTFDESGNVRDKDDES